MKRGQYVYKQGDPVLECNLWRFNLAVYFLIQGEAAFILPQWDDLPFLVIEDGDLIGIIDMVPEHKQTIVEKEVTRTFSVLAMKTSVVLSLSIEVVTCCFNDVGLPGGSKRVSINGQ